MSNMWSSWQHVGKRLVTAFREWPLPLTLLLLAWLFPMPVRAQSFDLPRVRHAVVRVLADRGNLVGSGFIIKVEERRGYVLTARHVIQRDINNEVSHVKVELFTEDTLEARISQQRIGKDGDDLAILVVENLPSPPPPEISWGISSALRETQRVLALGHPNRELSWAITEGTVSRMLGGRIYFSGTAVSPGNSGGPLLNEQGVVVGINLHLEGGFGVALEGDVIQPLIRSWVPGLPESVVKPPTSTSKPPQSESSKEPMVDVEFLDIDPTTGQLIRRSQPPDKSKQKTQGK